MIQRNKRKRKGIIETEWKRSETKSLPDIEERRRDDENDSDNDIGIEDHWEEVEEQSSPIPNTIKCVELETVNEHADDSDAGSLSGLRERMREDSDSESDSDTEGGSRNMYMRTQQRSEDVVSVYSRKDDSWDKDEIDSNLESIDSNWMTTTEEMKPIVPPVRLREGAIEDKISDYYDNTDILVGIVDVGK